MCLRIFWLCSFQLVCAALLLGNSSFRMSFHTESLKADQLQAAYNSSSFQQDSLQQEELAAAYCIGSFEHQSFHQDELEIACLLSPTRAHQLDNLEQMELCKRASFINQLDLDTSLSFQRFSLLRCSSNSFEQRALSCAALLTNPGSATASFRIIRFRAFSLQEDISALVWFKGELPTQLCTQELPQSLCIAQLRP